MFSNFIVLVVLSKSLISTANSTISPAKPGKSSVPCTADFSLTGTVIKSVPFKLLKTAGLSLTSKIISPSFNPAL